VKKDRVISIVGLSCRLPGAESVEEFSKLLFEERCAVSKIPVERWAHWRYLHPVPLTVGKSYSFAAGVIDDIFGFDPKVFNISPREATQIDPQQRLLLQLVWEAFEDANVPPEDLAGERVGVFVGASSLDYGTRLMFDSNITGSHLMTGNTSALLSNRISHVFDLRGPSMTVDTACSSSLVALHEAVKALETDEIDTAVVAGVNALLNPASFLGFSSALMLSEQGLCQSFSENADGYVRAEGAVVLVLHREHKKGRKFPKNYARVVDIATNSDGRTIGVALPSSQGQAELLENLYHRAKIDPNDLSFIEAHGTGTQAGDPIEAQALGMALGQKREKPLPIGSVKSNIGHLEPASGLAGVLKSILAFEQNKLPASLHAELPNKKIHFSELNLSLANRAIDLPDTGAPRFAGISSFGFGGTNAHLIIASSPAASKTSVSPTVSGGKSNEAIFFTSAFCKNSLQELTKKYVKSNRDADHSLVCNAAIHNRGVYPHRLAIIGNTEASFDDSVNSFLAERQNPRVFAAQSILKDEPPLFVYSGNGAQYPGMSLAALATDIDFAHHYRDIDRQFMEISGWSLINMLSDADLDQKIKQASVAQPLLFADQVALTRAFIDRGVNPAAVLGHSGGEITAAHCCGALDLDQALVTIFERSKSQELLVGRGTMAALQAAENEVQEALSDITDTQLTIAATNSPRSVTLVGPAEEIENFVQWARRKKRWAGLRLPVEYPYHSPMQDEIEDQLREGLRGIVPRESHIPFFSCVSGKEIEGKNLNVDYWWSLVREPVRFMDAVRAANEANLNLFIECGPRAVLTSYIKDSLIDHADEFAVTHSLEKTDGTTVNPVTRAISRAFVNGAKVDKVKVFGERILSHIQLPKYAWQNTEYRCDKTSILDHKFGISNDLYPLLGRAHDADANLWVSDLDAHLQPSLAQHIVGGIPILPGSAFFGIATAAAQRSLNSETIELRDIDIVAPLPLLENLVTEVRTQISSDNSSLTISSRPKLSEDQWRVHVSCRIGGASPQMSIAGPAPTLDRLVSDKDGAILYELAEEIGIEYGPEFQLVSHFRLVGDGSVEVILKPNVNEIDELISLDPFSTDAIFHGLLACLIDNNVNLGKMGYVPVHATRVRVLKPGSTIQSGRIKIHRIGTQSIAADFICFDPYGVEIAHLEGVRFRAARLIKQIDLETQSFGFRKHPVSSFNADGEMTKGPSTEEISRDILRIANTNEFEPDDDSFLLIEAVTQKIAYDTVRKFTNDNGIFSYPVHKGESEDADEDQIRTYLSGLLRMIERANLAQYDEENWTISATCGLPSVNDQISALIEEKPERIAECALLARMNQALPELVGGKIGWNTKEVFGRDAIVGLTAGSVVTTKRLNLMKRFLTAFLAVMPKTRCVRIAEISDGESSIIRDSSWLANTREFEFFDLNCSGTDARSVSADTNFISSPLVTSLQVDSDKFSNCEPFDLIVAPLGVSKVPSVEKFLSAIRAKISPSGIFVNFEDAPNSFHDLIFGIDPSWFSQTAAADFPIGPRRGSKEWESLLDNFGFEQTVISQFPDGISALACIVSTTSPKTKADDVTQSTDQSAVNFPAPKIASLSKLSKNGASTGFEAALETMLLAHAESYGHLLASKHDEIAQAWLYQHEGSSLNGGKEPFALCYLPDVSDIHPPQELLEARIMYLSRFLTDLTGGQLELWMIIPNGAGYLGADNQRGGQAALWSFMRTAKNEFPNLNIKCVDINTGSDVLSCMKGLIDLIKQGSAETEICLDAGQCSALRVHQGFQGGSTLDTTGGSETANRCTSLQILEPGRLDRLRWFANQRNAPGNTEVEICVEATGLNYRDVMWAMGLLPEEALESGFAGPTLGIEYSGIVASVGKDVQDLVVGDSVVSIGPNSFSSHITAERERVYKLPKGIDLASAATVPVAFFTAYYSLYHLARLKPGETVLIHGAAGGVGLAAIQVAKWCNAKIITTAGSNTKRNFLETLDVDCVLDSRSLKFADQVKSLTGGKGVDVVLNSLAGEAMERSLNSLRPFGRFLELGKQDFYANTRIGVRPFKENISYFGVDADQLLAVKTELVSQLFGEIMTLFEEGEFSPLPYRKFSGNQVADAFSLMQRSGHIGKILVKPAPLSDALPSPDKKHFSVSADGAHIIVGGMGGLGIETMNWLARNGAKTIILAGRNINPDQPAKQKIEKLRHRGIDVRLVQCDVSNKSAVDSLLQNLREEMPIRGVLHAAMVLNDTQIKSLDRDILKETLDAKVAGSINLDHATRNDDLNYFVLFSSIATLIGNHGQSAYVAANGYLEGLARHRKAMGLPALAIGWGAITDVGYLKQQPEKAKIVAKFSGGVEFSAKQALDALAKVMAKSGDANSDAVISITPMSWSPAVNTLEILKEPAYRTLSKLGQQSNEKGAIGDFRAMLLELNSNEIQEKLVEFITREISRILRVPVGELIPTRPVSEFGMDSLMGVEFGLAAQEAIGDDIPMMAISDALSIKDIAAKIASSLVNKHKAENELDVILGNLAAQHSSKSQDAPITAEQLGEIKRRETNIVEIIN